MKIKKIMSLLISMTILFSVGCTKNNNEDVSNQGKN